MRIRASILALALAPFAGACGGNRTVVRRVVEPPTLQQVRIPAGISVAAHVANDSAGTPTGWLDLTNRTTAAVELNHGACAFAVQLVREDGVTAYWQSVPPGTRACIMIARLVDIRAGRTVSIPAGTFARGNDVRAPPRGRHQAVVLYNDGSTRAVPAGAITIP